MRFGRRKQDEDAGTAAEAVDGADGALGGALDGAWDGAWDGALSGGPGSGAAVGTQPPGPRDVADVPAEELGDYIDLGSLLLPPRPDTELRLQVDEATGQVLAVLLLDAEGMLELRAFAGERRGDLWSDVRREIASDTAQRGGTATEQDGPFGPELYCQIPVQLEDGSSGVQPSRVIGHNGPRWFLRAALLGRPAIEHDAAEPWMETLRRVVVRRGPEPMPPGDALPLQLPPDAQRID
ncbi:MAG: DUF3710 domain-containing protein [Marmoricola sp.]